VYCYRSVIHPADIADYEVLSKEYRGNRAHGEEEPRRHAEGAGPDLGYRPALHHRFGEGEAHLPNRKGADRPEYLGREVGRHPSAGCLTCA